MEPRKFILPNLSKLSSSSGSIGNLGSSRGIDFSPPKTLQDFSSVETKKMEQATFKDSNEVTGKQDIESAYNLCSSRKSSEGRRPRPPSNKPEYPMRFESNPARHFKKPTVLKPAKSPMRTKKKSKSPLPGKNIVYQPPSPRFQAEVPARKQKVQPKSIDEKKSLIEYVNPREQIADLVMQVQKNSLPIALDKKYTYDKRIVFMPSDNPSDDPAGSILFTKHGFFEIPKEKNMLKKCF